MNILKTPVLLFPLFLALSLAACSSAEPCTGEFAADSDWDLLDGTTWPADMAYCEFQMDSIETMTRVWKKAHFDHYSGGRHDDLVAAMNYWDDFLKGKGFVYDPLRMPTNHVIPVEMGVGGTSIRKSEDELESLINNENFREAARFYAKEDVGLYVRFSIPHNEPKIEVTIDNSASASILKEGFSEGIPAMLRYYKTFASIRDKGANVENKSWKPTAQEYPSVFYAHASSARIENLFLDVLLNHKFYFQTEDFYHHIAKGPAGTLTPNDFAWLQIHLLQSDYFAIYKRQKIVQPQATGEASEYSSGSAGNVRTEYYKEGYEKGFLYLLDAKTMQVISKTDVKVTSAYDFEEAPYEEDPFMKEYCQELAAKVLGKDTSEMWWYAYEDYYQGI